MTQMKSRVKKILEYIFPNFTCLACGCEIENSVHLHVCDECFAKFAWAKPPKISAKVVCKSLEKIYLQDIYCPLIYKAPVSKMILALKYSATGQVAQIFAPFMVKTLVGEGKIPATNFDLIIPVPLAKARLRDRGFNQAKILAEEILNEYKKIIEAKGSLSELVGQIEICETVLLKIRKTTPQTDMNEQQRKDNQKDAYAVCQHAITKIKGKRILLVDDVLTSGATANECVKVLVKAGAKSVSLLVIA